MFNFIKHLILFPLLPLCASCAISPTKELIAKSTIKLDGNDTNIRDVIEIDGYYVEGGLEVEISTRGGRLIFFEDGTYARNFFFKEGLAIENVMENMSGSLRRDIHRHKRGQWNYTMGVYRIEGDMIIGHLYWPPNNGFLFAGGGWALNEERYKIVNRTTVKRVYSRGLLKTDETRYRDLGKSPWRSDPPHIFIPAKNLPSDNWLKEEPWIWHNESDWRVYMDRLKGQQTPELPRNKPKPPKTQKKPSKHAPPDPSSIGRKP